VLRDLLFINGIDQDYTRWIWYSENTRDDEPFNLNKKRYNRREEVGCNEGDKVKDLVHDVVENFMDCPKILDV